MYVDTWKTSETMPTSTILVLSESESEEEDTILVLSESDSEGEEALCQCTYTGSTANCKIAAQKMLYHELLEPRIEKVNMVIHVHIFLNPYRSGH